MKNILTLIYFGLLIGCSSNPSSNSPKVFFFIDTDDPEVLADYNYHLNNVIDYLDQKGIGHEIANSRVIRLEDKDLKTSRRLRLRRTNSL